MEYLKNPRLDNLPGMLANSGRICTCDCGKPKLPIFSKHMISEISSDQTKNTKILRNRSSIFEILSKKQRPLNIIEIGVLAGDFANEMLESLQIQNLYLIDPFNINDGAAKSDGVRFTNETHLNYIIEKFKNYIAVKICQGFSNHELIKFLEFHEGDKMDFIYIDSSHGFENVYNDILYSTQILKIDGIIGIDDMSLFLEDPSDKSETIQAVTRFLANNKDWEVSYYSFHDNGLPNIYLSKINQ